MKPSNHNTRQLAAARKALHEARNRELAALRTLYAFRLQVNGARDAFRQPLAFLTDAVLGSLQK